MSGFYNFLARYLGKTGMTKAPILLFAKLFNAMQVLRTLIDFLTNEKA